MIRFICVVIFVVSFLILSIPLLIAEWIVGKFNQSAKDRSSLAIIQWAFRQVLRISGTKVIIRGKENIPTDTPVLYVANHRSFFDILIAYVQVLSPTGFISKKEMLKWPLLRDWMRYLHCLFLDRENVKEGLKTILTAIEKIKSGISIFVFPEGTRNKVNDTFLPIHEGSLKIAVKTGVPVVPVSIVNSAAIFEDQFPKIKKTTVIVEYCKPILVKELNIEERKQVGACAFSVISDTYFKNKELLTTQKFSD